MKKAIALVLAVCTIFALSSCGESIGDKLIEKAISSRIECNGYNKLTNTTITLDCFSMSVPDYWGEATKDGKTLMFIAEAQNAKCIAMLSANDSAYSDEEFIRSRNTLMDEYLSDLSIIANDISYSPSEFAGLGAYEFTGSGIIDNNFLTITIEGMISHDEDIGKIFIAAIFTPIDSELSFTEDFNRVLASAQIIQQQKTAENNSGVMDNSSGVVKNSLEVTDDHSDIIAFLDSYEAFIDDYIDFMKKYFANPYDLNMLAEYADFLDKYADMIDKVDAIDEDELTDEELAYYIDVTARVSKKLLEIGG